MVVPIRVLPQVQQQATTLWYHPHFIEATAEQVYEGLAGMIIIDEHVPLGSTEIWEIENRSGMMGQPHTFHVSLPSSGT
ncbi:MAG: hypothetical protein DRP49_02530 [Spirochaetes bacterium]|nr:MAG: hypothetical protein DRP49_02530 [Spirochaetota bacterium]